MTKSFKVEVQADGTGTWAGNGVRFETFEQAESYARDLAWRWTSVREWRVVASPDLVNRTAAGGDEVLA